MESENESQQVNLIDENKALRRALALSLNNHLIKKLKEALDRINNGEYISEEEFFNNS